MCLISHLCCFDLGTGTCIKSWWTWVLTTVAIRTKTCVQHQLKFEFKESYRHAVLIYSTYLTHLYGIKWSLEVFLCFGVGILPLGILITFPQNVIFKTIVHKSIKNWTLFRTDNNKLDIENNKFSTQIKNNLFFISAW